MTFATRTWAAGDTITAARLQNLNDGIVAALGKSFARQAVLVGALTAWGAPAFLDAPSRITPLMTAATQDGFTASASSNSSTAHRAFNLIMSGNAGKEYWVSTGTTGTLTIQLPAARYVSTYQITGYATANYSPKDWTLEGSNDGAAWTTLDTRTGVTGWAANETKTYTPATTGSYLYYRLNVTANDGGANLCVTELGLFGRASSATDTSVGLLAASTAVALSLAEGFDVNGPIDRLLRWTADVAAAWSSFTNSSTNYLWIDYAAGSTTYGATTLAPVYDYVAPGSPASGQAWFDLSAYVMKVYNGSSWDTKSRAFVGEVEVNGSAAITSTTTYAYCGQALIPRRTAEASAPYSYPHNVGTDLVEAQVFEATSGGGALAPLALTSLTRNAVTFSTGASGAQMQGAIRRAF